MTETQVTHCASCCQDGRVCRCVYFWVCGRDSMRCSFDIYHLPAAEKLPAQLERDEAHPEHWKHISIYWECAAV